MDEKTKDEEIKKIQDGNDHPVNGKKATSRRDFMKNIGLIGASAVAGGAALYSGHIFETKKEKSGQAKILLTQDNKLVEVDSLEIRYLEKNPEDKLLALKSME